LRATQTRSVFDPRPEPITSSSTSSKQLGLPELRQVTRSPEDEILLTELTFDSKDIITYEISSIVLVAEEKQSNPSGKFRCFFTQSTKEFFIEIPDENTMRAFNQSALVNILGLAEKAGAETVFVCVRRTVHRQQAYLKNFLFVGFEKLTEEEQKEISMTKTHSILKCSLKSDEENDD
jgi:N-acetylglutamate synthase-like GNAT family acetyltransferase